MAQGTQASNDDARKAAIEKLAAIDFNTHSNAQIEKALNGKTPEKSSEIRCFPEFFYIFS